MLKQKRTWAEINLDNIEHNYKVIKSIIPEGCKFLGVVKADAYGHGAVQVSRRLESAGADYLAVASLDEAMELRDAGISLPILILGHTPPQYVPILIENNITQTVTCAAKAFEYSASAAKHGGTLKIHIKIDTGMGRLGFLSEGSHQGDCIDGILRTCNMDNLDAEGIYTHFSVSDEPDNSASHGYTLCQFALFTNIVDKAEKIGGFTFPIRHCANSGAVLNYKEACLDMVRPGLLLYGYGDGGKLGLKPCMRLVTTVSTIKHYDSGTSISYGRTYTTDRITRAGVLPIGYADGLFRSLSNKCVFSAGGVPVPQIGRICMDMCIVDLTDAPDVHVDSTIEIFGENVSLDELSEAAGTIPYELLCSVSKRVPRVY